MAGKGKLTPAVTYLRTSGAGVGAEKDSDKRQRQGSRRSSEPTSTGSWASSTTRPVSGADPIETRTGLHGPGKRCPPCHRRDRQPLQEVGYAKLQALGTTLVAVSTLAGRHLC
jgi:hypothetical protein